MKKIKKVVYFIFMSLLLGGCANKSNGTSVKVYDTTDTLSGTLTYGALYIEPQTQHMIDLFMKEHPDVKIETKIVFDNDVTGEQYKEGLNALITELASDQRADIYDAMYLPC